MTRKFKAPTVRLNQLDASDSSIGQTSLGMRTTGGEQLVFEKSVSGRMGVNLPEFDVPHLPVERHVDSRRLRKEPLKLPELSELDVVRHYTRLSKLNYSVDENFYPLGSCTMKYNPRINEEAVRLPGFARLHPETPVAAAQGALELMHELGNILIDFTGMVDVTLVPGAGAHGELAGVMMMRLALEAQEANIARTSGDETAIPKLRRNTMLIPDSAHGTNPATCTLAGLKTKQVPTGPRGVIEVADVVRLVDEHTAGIMITNPNTLGLFEENIQAIADVIHQAGGFVYMDGANLNALLGKARPGDLGVDALHINLHKTFAQPHGGGGPGAGPVVVSSRLQPFLPYPRIIKREEAGNVVYDLIKDGQEHSLGYLREFGGNFGVFVRAYSYILRLGSAGLCEVSEKAVLNANYIKARLAGKFHLPYNGKNLHEVVFDDEYQHKYEVSTLDIAKRLLDYGYHPPTVYFPLVVKGALMIEPTETESKQTLDMFCNTMLEIATEAEESPEVLKHAPYTTPVARLDETKAARKPKLRAGK